MLINTWQRISIKISDMVNSLQSDFRFSERAGSFTNTVVKSQMVRVALCQLHTKVRDSYCLSISCPVVTSVQSVSKTANFHCDSHAHLCLYP